jgi:uncharacterized protein YneF (UPF0154 family)
MKLRLMELGIAILILLLGGFQLWIQQRTINEMKKEHDRLNEAQMVLSQICPEGVSAVYDEYENLYYRCN